VLLVSKAEGEHAKGDLKGVVRVHGYLVESRYPVIASVEVAVEGAGGRPHGAVRLALHQLSDPLLLVRVVVMDLLEMVGGALGEIGASRVQDVGNLESVISRLDDKEARLDEREHVLRKEAVVRLIAIFGNAPSLRERNSRLVDRGIKSFHLELVIILSSFETLVIHIKGAVRQCEVIHSWVPGTNVIHEVIGPGIGSEGAS